jgi:hypothetical protein
LDGARLRDECAGLAKLASFSDMAQNVDFAIKANQNVNFAIKANVVTNFLRGLVGDW